MLGARAALAGVLALSAVLYLHKLDRAPVYIGWDEARFALQGHAIATTGHDLNGHATPLFFHNTDPLVPNNSSLVWWQPFLIYLIAFVLQFAPLSEWAVRLPTVGLALLNVWLMYAVARRLFSSRWYAVLAALLLALTPAHFLFGRMASDYFCPIPFALAWFWCLLCLVQTDAPWLPAATGLLLGIGLYSYIASWLMMPFFLAITAVVLWLSRWPRRAIIELGAGFAVPLLPLVPWFVWHPGLLNDTLRGYQVVTGAHVAERVALYWDYFNPSYLFFSGGSDAMWATRKAGVFALAFAALLPCGLWSIWRRGASVGWTVVLVGFVSAPAAIVATLPEAPRYATARALLAIPFGVLIAVAGVEWLIAQRSAVTRLAAALLVIGVPIQFVAFARDYFDDYQRRSSYRFDQRDLGDVAAYVIQSDASANIPAVYLSDDLGTGKSVQWKFHLTRNGRPDLWERTRYYSDATPAASVPSGSVLVVDPNDPRIKGLLDADHWSIVRLVRDVADAPAAAILRRH